MEQLQLIKLDGANPPKINLEPKVREELIGLMADAIETVYLAQQKRSRNELDTPKDQT